MPHQYILANLLAEADDAVGVLFFDDEGEIVDVAARREAGLDLEVIGAYLGIYLKRARSLAKERELGRPRLLHVVRERLTILACVLSGGYGLAVVQETGHGAGRSSRSLLRAAADLEREVLTGIGA